MTTRRRNERRQTRTSVCLVIPRGNEVLAISRPGRPDDFGLIGGGVELSDGPGEAGLRRAMVREAWEEAGLRLSPAQLRTIHAAQARSRFATTFVYDGNPGAPALGPREEGVLAWVHHSVLLRGTFAAPNRPILRAAGFLIAA